MPKHLTNLNIYRTLVSKISKEISELEFFVKRRTVEGYWNIGKYIHEHLLAHKERAEYGATLYERLAKDVDRDISTLQRSVRFYRTYPIPAARRELSWDHYRRLITIKDKDQRKKLEDQIVRNKWDTRKVQEYLNVKRELAAPDDKPVLKLTFTRGRPLTYRVVTVAGKDGLFVDVGFRLRQICGGRFKEGDCVEVSERGNLRKVETKVVIEELFTYQGQVVKVIDGDTLTVLIDPGFGFLIEQKLRLRGIDCPEMDTKEGQRAKRFVEARLKGCDFIIVKTYKDRSDKFDRYLTDVYYAAKGDASDPGAVAREGVFLNQELLDEHLAVRYES